MLGPRLRAAALSGTLALTLGLAACGSEDGDGAQGAGLDGVTIKGAFGKKVEVDFEDRLAADQPEVEVLTQGDGETLEKGDTALAHWWVGNGYTKKEAQNGFGGAPTPIPVSDEVFPGLLDAVEGHQVGSRVAVLADAQDAFGELGNPQLGIGNKDTALIIVDIVGSLLSSPEGEERKPAKWAPAPVEKDGKITGLDFSDAHEPKGNLLHTTLVKGEGPVVEKGQTIYVDYLGQVPGSKKPFDESFSKEPASFPIGVGGVVKGWDEVLVGRTVGSRMILEIPPNKGYGAKGRPEAGIKGTDTMFFVIDILGAA